MSVIFSTKQKRKQEKMWSCSQIMELTESFFFLPFCFTIFAFLLATLLLKWYWEAPSPALNNRSLPPSPAKLPVLGNLLQLGSQPHEALQAMAQTHGPLMLLHLGSIPVVVVSSAEMAREVMKTNDLVFSDRPKSSLADKLLYYGKDVAFAPYGEYWRQMKRVCVLHLLSNKMVHSFRHVREEETSLMIRKIKQSSSSSVNLSDMFMKLTNDVVCRVALGKKYGLEEDGGRFKEVLKDFVKLLGVFSIGEFIPFLGWLDKINGLVAKTEKVAEEIDRFLDRVVEEHVQSRERKKEEEDEGNHKDFVEVLLEIQRENSIGLHLDPVSIKAIILDMFAAGTDTTYTLMEWTMAELLRNPDIMKKLQNEVRRIAGENPFIKEEDLDKMDYLRAVIKETLRLHPPIPLLVPRLSTDVVTIKGFEIPARTRVIVNAWAIGREAGMWEDPEEFRPERFVNSSVDFKGMDFQLIPFGAGRRGCPGISFAAAVNELALANVVGLFDWALPGGEKAENLGMAGSSGLTIHRKLPLLALPTPISCE